MAVTFVTDVETTFANETTPKTTPSFTVAVGDILICIVGADEPAKEFGNVPTNSGTGFTWTLIQSRQTGAASCAPTYMWAATATAAQTMTVTQAPTTSAPADCWWGLAVQVWRGAELGASVVGGGANGSPSLGLTTTAANSAISCIITDENGVASTTRTYNTVNVSATETTYHRDASWLNVFFHYYSDAGAAGSKTLGMSAPTNLDWSLIGVELKDASAASNHSGSVALSGSGTLTFSGTPAENGSLGLSGSGTLALDATPLTAGTLDLAGAGSLSLASIPTPTGNLALSGSGTIGFSSIPALLSSLALAGEGAVMFTAEPFVPSSLGLGGEGTLSFAADNFSGTLNLSGSGSLAMTGIPFVPSDLALAGDGDLTFASQPFVPASSGFSGAGSLALAGEPNEVGSLALSGAGALTFAASPVVLGSVDYAGSGTLAGGSGMTLVPLASIASASGWSASGGTVLEVLGDSSDETLITSSGDPSNVLFDGTFGAIVAPSGDFTVRVRAYKASASSGTLTGKLYVNTTLKSTVSAPIPDVLGDVYLVFPAGDLATITAPDWAAGVRITLAATAT